MPTRAELLEAVYEAAKEWRKEYDALALRPNRDPYWLDRASLDLRDAVRALDPPYAASRYVPMIGEAPV